MTIGARNFVGRRLTEARRSRGWSKSELAAAIGVSGTAIGRYESGLDSPTVDRLESIAKYFKFPVSFFSRPVWPEDPTAVHWRSQAGETKRAREMTGQRMTWMSEVFGFLELELQFPEFRLPAIDMPDFRDLTGGQIEAAARQVREEWGLKEYPIPDVVLALENNGIPVTMLTIPSDKQDGFTFTSRALSRSFVGINSSEVSRVRGRFDAAHELGHLILHRNVPDAYADVPMYHNLLESQAHRFAGALLFPEGEFFSQVDSVSLDYLSGLKSRWGISIAAMVMRAMDLQLVGSDTVRDLFRQMTRRGWRGRRREPLDDLELSPLESPRMLRRGIEELSSGGVFAKAALLNALAMPASEVEAIAGLRPGYFDEVPEPLVTRRAPIAAVDLETGTVIQFPSRKQPR